METQKEWLSVFWAVTTSSLYQAHISGTGEIPRVTKVAGKTANPQIAIGTNLCRGTMLAVGERLVLFVPEGGGYGSSYQRQLRNVNTRYWGEYTSVIIGLFLREADARACYASNDLVPKDTRWHTQTVETLRAIGKEHPYCSILTEPFMQNSSANPLVDPKEWQT